MSTSRAKAECTIGTALPRGARDVQYAKVQPSPELSYYTAFIKFAAGADDFSDLMRRMEMGGRGSDAANRLLPAPWTMPEQPAWWDAAPNTPENAAAKQTHYNGWIVAKYESERVYIIVSETGIASEPVP